MSITERASVWMPETSSWVEGIVSYGVPIRLVVTKHELLHELQIANADPYIIKSRTVTANHGYSFIPYDKKDLSKGFVISYSDKGTQDIKITAYSGGRIFFDDVIPKEDILAFIFEYNDELRLGL